ncbi:hypothetical protein [Pseudomonas aeruginosa]|uniref:hypothetical protein n=1 Tax=Pseudomonas aeruginosa TaxID=287 RepID=UPI0034E0BAFE
MTGHANSEQSIINALLDGATAHADRAGGNDDHIECLQELLVAALGLMSPDQLEALTATEIGMKLTSHMAAVE